MKNYLKIVILSIMLSSFVSVGFAQIQANTTTTVDVSVALVAQITVLPTSLTWTDVVPSSTGGLRNLTVRNTGSLNVSSLYMYTDTIQDERVNPLSSSNASSYAAGGVVVVKNQTTSQNFYFTGRLEWNSTNSIASADYSAVDDPVSYGFFKNTSAEYVWVIGNGTYITVESNTTGACNSSATQFAIETDFDTGVGSTRTPNILASYIANDTNYTYMSFASGPLNGYCVAINKTCNNAFIYKFDKRPTPNAAGGNFAACTSAANLNAGPLTPGAFERLTLDTYIPAGFPAGNMIQATLTFTANS